MVTVANPGLERRLKGEDVGEVLFDNFTRGRYATDASSYQMMPLGVVVPKTLAQAEKAMAVARAEGVTVTPRGGGTSQCGQTVNHSVVVDCSKYLNKIVSLDAANKRCVVQPGIVLDELNRQLKPHGLWFPVDISTASRATIGGMSGNNSCGTRSLRYGVTRDNVMSIDAVLPNGKPAHFGPVSADLSELPADSPLRGIAKSLLALGAREADEINERFPKIQRRVGGYNIDEFVPKNEKHNLAHILIGSEGTLAFTTQVELKLWPVLGKRLLGVCHFGQFYEAMNSAQHLVKLKPIAVELIDKTMLDLAGAIPMFRPTLEKFIREEPEAVLLVEFDDGPEENARKMKQLVEMMGDLGFSWDGIGAKWGGVVEIADPALQTAIADVRASGLNIMMSMKDERKPVSFIEDCAVPLEHLADYTDRLNQVFEKYGTKGTFYAHASVGCLHVRPVLNLKQDKDLKAMRAIAEEAFALVKEYKGSHSGEHGDGIVRSEFHEPMFGGRLVRAFGEVKGLFDPDMLFNPGKIVGAPKFDDKDYLRFNPNYGISTMKPALDWSEYPGGAKGLQGAVEMCNNNGACRKHEGGAMCPSYRATMNERDVTRGRANSLRLALSGQLGPDAFASDDMMETLKLCVSCKACRRECPTGVDMAKMKIEVLAARTAKNGLSLRDRLIAYLPRYAATGSRFSFLLNLRDQDSRSRQAQRDDAGPDREAPAAALAQRRVRAQRDEHGSARRPRGRALRRHVQPLLRPRKPRRRARCSDGRGLSRAYAQARERRSAAALLRTHVPLLRSRERGSRRTHAHGRSALAVRKARRAHRRPRAELPLHLPRRAAIDHAGRRRQDNCRSSDAVRGVRRQRDRRQAVQSRALAV